MTSLWRELLEHGLAAFVGALVAGLVVAYPILRFLRLIGSRQAVSPFAPQGHQAKQGTPTMGGVIVLIALLSGILLHVLSSDAIFPWAWFATIAAFAAIGFLDDHLVPRLFEGKRGLGWIPKLCMQGVAAGFAVPALGLEFHLATYALVALFILFFVNAFNFADGLDGLAGGLGIVLFCALGFIGWDVPMGSPAIWCFAAIGALIPFLILNAPPAKVFMGDVGSLPLGALIGLLAFSVFRADPAGWSAQSGAEEARMLTQGGLSGDGSLVFTDSWRTLFALLALSFVLIVEIVPVPLQILSVKLFKRKLFPMTPIHHAFEAKGWRESRIVWTFILAQLVAAVLAVALLFPAVPRGAPANVGDPMRGRAP